MTLTGMDLDAVVALAAEEGFSGAFRVDLADGSVAQHSAGMADRRWSIPFTVDTTSAIASATKGFTSLVVMALVDAGVLALDTPARSLLGSDLALIDDAVTIHHLLAHRSGIGDYIDEAATPDIKEYVMPVPVHRLDSMESFIEVLDGWPQVSAPGARFAYNNSGFVVLAILAERATATPYADLVAELVCRPAGLAATTFVRSDALAPGAATGYLDRDGLRTNALHLPLLGGGDGGLYSTVDDVRRLWVALFDGRIVAPRTVESMMTPPGEEADEDRCYGLGFWLHPNSPWVRLEGYDAGVSFCSWHDPREGITHTVIGNWTDAAWPVTAALRAALGPG